MNEDKLTRGERIRLEAFAQAVNTASLPFDAAEWNKRASEGHAIIHEGTVFAKAERIERWLKRADEDAMKGAN